MPHNIGNTVSNLTQKTRIIYIMFNCHIYDCVRYCPCCIYLYERMTLTGCRPRIVERMAIKYIACVVINNYALYNIGDIVVVVGVCNVLPISV